ncbi:PIN domain-containing protein [Alkalilimnicola sp. S0819]|uniref:PIN domain-containing protein n=1 Tax=Alkalilimnicola sp. S0819 TaxID=2613922 RepID=UPI00126169FD|nr:PIN domain-containing protein [Alkalilimnicola sp. S0819]KAB7627601.1 PIN domain-containing protein [Alkalilimnicola sp. S0819]MPQ15763.1 PIN domain-containing protein [Alkalilimnicola sp. S0819]
MRFVVIYDACVLYPAPLRDLLIRLAMTGMFAARWTEQIHDEWMRNLVAKRPELREAVYRTRTLMNEAVPDCLVEGHEPLIDGLTLPDPDDRHVLAAAIRAGAQLIVTANLKDFPAKVLDGFGIEAVHPDRFVEQQMDLHEGVVVAAAKQQRAALRNPPVEATDFLDLLAAQGLVVTADRLRAFQQFI